MELSLNQIEHTARKAVRGAGLPWGLADDAGRAVRWLETLGLAGMSWLADLLFRVDHRPLRKWRIRPQSTGWQGASGVISPLLAGPSLSDILPLYRQQLRHQLTLRAVVCPQLCVGYLGVASLQTGVSMAVSWARVTVEVMGDGVRYAGQRPPDFDQGPHDLDIYFAHQTESAASGLLAERVGSRQVDVRVLDRLESLVRRTYVENTDTSRLSGAGAGIRDTD